MITKKKNVARTLCFSVVLLLGFLLADGTAAAARARARARARATRILNSDNDNNVLTQIGGDIPPPQGETGELCLMDTNRDGSCIAQAYYDNTNAENGSRAHVFCRSGDLWELKGGVNDMRSTTAKKYCSITMNDTADRVAVADEENGMVDIYHYEDDGSGGSSWILKAQFATTGGGGVSSLDMNGAGTKLVVGDSTNKRYYAYELLVGTSSWTQVHVHTSSSSSADYANVVALKSDGSVFAVSRHSDLQVDLVAWDSWTTTTFSSTSQSATGQIVDGTFSGDGTRFVMSVDDTSSSSAADDVLEIHEVSGSTHVGLVSQLHFGSLGNQMQGRTALNHDGTVLALSNPYAQDSKGALWLLRFDVASGNYVTVATLIGSEDNNQKEGLGKAVELSTDGSTLVTNTLPSASSGGGQSSLLGNLKVFDVNLGPAPTMAPTKETFVVSYAGNAIAGFGGDFEGSEVVIPFVVSPKFNKEVSLFLEDCATAMPTSLMTATSKTAPINKGGNLLNLSVSLALNLPNIGALQQQNDDTDHSLWKGPNDSASKVLTFCVRVDLMSDQDLVTGDSLTGKTSVNYESVVMEVEVDFTAEFGPSISAILDAPEVLPPVLVAPEVYGVTGCHCDPTSRACFDKQDNPAPPLSPQDTLDVCFEVSAADVGIASVTSFPVSQGDLWFDPVQAGPSFYSAQYEGNTAVFMSRLPSAFFFNVGQDISATATMDLSFDNVNASSVTPSHRHRRELGTASLSSSSRSPPAATSTTTATTTTTSISGSRRHLQDITFNPNFGVDIAVQIEVQGVALTLDDGSGDGGGGIGSTHHVLVPASIYGVTGCHCDASTFTCYGRYDAPALTKSDTLDVCFRVTTTGVSIADIAAFTVYQGLFRFNAVLAGSGFFEAQYRQDSAVGRSRLPSAFFDNVQQPLSATATLELQLGGSSRRALVSWNNGDDDDGGGASSFAAALSSSTAAADNNDKKTPATAGASRRHLQDLSSNADVAVVVGVEGVLLSPDDANNVGNEDEKKKTNKTKKNGGGFPSSKEHIAVLIVVGVTALVIVVLLCVMFRRMPSDDDKDSSTDNDPRHGSDSNMSITTDSEDLT